MKKKLLLTFITFIIVISVNAMVANAGTTFNTATKMLQNTNYNCTIRSYDSVEYYYFIPGESGYYTFLSEGDVDTYGLLYNAGKSQINNDDDSNGNGNFKMTEYLYSGSTYYLGAKLYSDSYGSFTVRVEHKQSLSSAAVSLSAASFTYSGSQKKPTPTVVLGGRTLQKDVDYTVSYSNNVNAGTASCRITGIGNYEGSAAKTFKINRRKITSGAVSLSKTSYNYNGEAKRPTVKIKIGGKKLYEYDDFSVSYKNNKNAGKATVTVSGTGNYTGTVKKTFTIKKKRVTSCKIYNSTYSGKKIVPSIYYKKKVYDSYYDYSYYVEAKYKKGRDYSIKVSGGHKSIGEYKVTIKFKGNYKGTVKKKFKILPKPVKKVKTKAYSTKAIKVSWSKVPNVTGYKIYRFNTKKYKYYLYKTTTSTSCIINRYSGADNDVTFYIRTYKKVGNKTFYNLSEKDCWDYEYVKPGKASYTVKKTDFAEFTLIFKYYKNYQIQYSNNKHFSNDGWDDWVRTYEGSTDYFRVYNLTSGKKYYIRARVYFYDKNRNLKVGPWVKKSVTVY